MDVYVAPNPPYFLVEYHILRDVAEIEYISGPLQFSAIKLRH
jgi:hypothetical protein